MIGPGAAGAVAAGPGPDAPAVGEPTIEGGSVAAAAQGEEPVEVQYDVDLRPENPDAVEVTIEVTIPDDADVDELWFYPYEDDYQVNYRVLDSDGIDDFGGLWTDTTRSNPSITLEFEPAVESSPGDYNHLATDEWAFVRLRTDYDGEAPLEETVGPDGVKGLEYLYVGDHETYERDAYGQRIRLVVPAAAQLEAAPTDVLDSLVYESRHLRVGERNEELYVFVAPSPPIRGGGAAPWTNHDFWVSDGSSLWWNTWGHEYVHTRQDARPSESAEWLVEAEARYYQYLLSYQQGHIDGGHTYFVPEFEAFRYWIEIDRDAHAGVELADPDSWKSSSNYEKGALVLAALDAEIRERTDGAHTYQDVLRERNTREGLDYAGFADAIEAATGERFDDFLDRYVAGTEVPAVPDDESLYEQGGHEFDVAYDLAIDFESETNEDGTIAPGGTGALSYTLENAGSDPSVVPEATVDLPDGWEVESVEVAASDSSEWTTTGETVSTAEFAPGDAIDVRVTVRAPEDVTGSDPIGVTVVDADGYRASEAVTVSGVEAPEADLAVDDGVAVEGETTIAIEGEPVTLDAGDSEAEAGVASYEWDLTGDGEVDATTTKPTLERAFEPGERTVTVTVVDENGLEDAATVPLTVTDVPALEIDSERVVSPGAPTSLEANVTNEIGETTVTWTLPDGTEFEGESLERAFEAGVHELAVRVVDEYGAESTTVAAVVSNDAPAIEAVAPDVVTAGEPAPFEATVENEVGETTVVWELPDGTELEGDFAEVELAPGDHDVSVAVEDEYGGRAETIVEVVSNDVPEIAVDAPSVVDVGGTAALEAVVENEVGGTTVTWTLPGGTELDGHFAEVELESGDHDVSVAVEDEYGARSTEAVAVTVREAVDGGGSAMAAAPSANDSTAAHDGQPGFGAVPAIAALLALVAIAVRRR